VLAQFIWAAPNVLNRIILTENTFLVADPITDYTSTTVVSMMESSVGASGPPKGLDFYTNDKVCVVHHTLAGDVLVRNYAISSGEFNEVVPDESRTITSNDLPNIDLNNWPDAPLTVFGLDNEKILLAVNMLAASSKKIRLLFLEANTSANPRIDFLPELFSNTALINDVNNNVLSSVSMVVGIKNSGFFMVFGTSNASGDP
jgi:hypothetical protein